MKIIYIILITILLFIFLKNNIIENYDNKKNIYFINNSKLASNKMRSIQIYQKLKNNNLYLKNNIDYINNIIIFLVKDCSINFKNLHKIKEKNNIIILDVLDLQQKYYYNKSWIKNIDYLIVNNIYMKKYFSKYINEKNIFIIYHHYDPIFNTIKLKKINKLLFIFNGDNTNNNCLYLDKLKQKYDIIIINNFNKFINHYNFKNVCFLNIRLKNSFNYLFKPCIKLSQACASFSNIITTRDKSIQDLLSNDYPYLLKNNDYDSVLIMMNYVIKTYNTDIWYNGLKMINKLRNKLNINYIINNDYKKILNKINS